MSLGDELSAHHHPSHRHLLTAERADRAPHAHVDAVIVPTARPVESLSTAIDLVSKLGSVLVALCSRDVSADQVLSCARAHNVSTVAIDVGDIDNLPTFNTTLAVNGSRFERTTDLSHKRNLGLLLSRVVGWQRVLFLDDDMDEVHPSDIRAAAGLLNRYDVVGLNNIGFPDNSVVCRVGGRLNQFQDQFIGAGALAVAPSKMGTFFPDIYNEDWFFFQGASRMAVTGSVSHRRHDRAIDASRAREEELGDCLGEGLYWALDDGVSTPHLDSAHWDRFLGDRRKFIERLDTINDRDFQLSEVTPALDVAYRMCEAIAGQPDLCDGYMQLWRTDLALWADFIREEPTRLGLLKALTELGWYGIAQLHLLPCHEEDRLIFPNGWERAAADQQAGRTSDRSGQSSPLA